MENYHLMTKTVMQPYRPACPESGHILSASTRFVWHTDWEGEDTEAKKGKRIFTSYLFRGRKGSGVAFSQEPPPPPPETVRRPARVARMLALAHRLQSAIKNGEYQDRAELARQFDLTRARITQLLNLTLLAPDLQEQVLDLEAIDGLEPTSERALRGVTGLVNWGEQRKRGSRLFSE
jgi:hypothetical protein